MVTEFEPVRPAPFVAEQLLVTPGVSVAAKRTPQSTAPAAVAAKLEEVRRWLDGAGRLC